MKSGVFSSAAGQRICQLLFSSAGSHQIMGLDYSLFSNFIFIFIFIFNYIIIIIYKILYNRLNATADLIVVNVKFILIIISFM